MKTIFVNKVIDATLKEKVFFSKLFWSIRELKPVETSTLKSLTVRSSQKQKLIENFIVQFVLLFRCQNVEPEKCWYFSEGIKIMKDLFTLKLI